MDSQQHSRIELLCLSESHSYCQTHSCICQCHTENKPWEYRDEARAINATGQELYRSKPFMNQLKALHDETLRGREFDTQSRDAMLSIALKHSTLHNIVRGALDATGFNIKAEVTMAVLLTMIDVQEYPHWSAHDFGKTYNNRIELL